MSNTNNFSFSILFLLISLSPILAQSISLSELEVRDDIIEENEKKIITLRLKISDISSSPSLKVTVNESQDCNGLFEYYFHLKAYNDGTYLKHNGKINKLKSGETLELTLEMDSFQWEIANSVCVVATKQNEVVSNIINKTLDK